MILFVYSPEKERGDNVMVNMMYIYNLVRKPNGIQCMESILNIVKHIKCLHGVHVIVRMPYCHEPGGIC